MEMMIQKLTMYELVLSFAVMARLCLQEYFERTSLLVNSSNMSALVRVYTDTAIRSIVKEKNTKNEVLYIYKNWIFNFYSTKRIEDIREYFSLGLA